ncbi:ABC transporter component protein [Salinisphaera shabanensis E1L3A]|uniref:ABC transporter component protein n=1 Tax=Salinisphaera shabanensis E1L3A TaxID=1033802 RepID=U2FUY1_9GAMM|nr:ATP-binding cassette domain-containing protein [Salinisphaera shabanensis]ERJ19739.1 ABC transporter component protein [Salinisphaera shabanensis E1L3A]
MAELDPSQPLPEKGVVVRDLTLAYGDTVVQQSLSFHVRPASIFVIMGVSGCGKSTLLRHMIDLEQAEQGDVVFDGHRLWTDDSAERAALQRRIGVLFQSTALWSSMSVGENVGLPLQLHTRLSAAEIRDQVAFKLALVGLAGQESRMPSELSGGMQKRAGLARAIALDPDYLFLDEPSAGLDPITSQRLDALIMSLRDALQLSVIAVTHELPSIFTIADDSIYLDNESRCAIAHGDPRVLAEHAEHARVRAFLNRQPIAAEDAAP